MFNFADNLDHNITSYLYCNRLHKEFKLFISFHLNSKISHTHVTILLEVRTMFKDKRYIVTGGASGIGKCITETLQKEGASVEIIDIVKGDYFVGDLSNRSDLNHFIDYIRSKHTSIDGIIHCALPITVGIREGRYEDFENALAVGAIAPFFLTQQLVDMFSPSASIILMSSTRAHMSQPQSESYAAAKGATESLVHAMAASLAGRVRVNGIAPGWIDTHQSDLSDSDRNQHSVKRVGTPNDIAQAVLFLMSDNATFINGQILTIDGGMTKTMVYHGDYGWSYKTQENA